MAIRWINNYHRGFNRLWLVLAVIGAFAFVVLNAWIGKYRVDKPGGRIRVFPVGVSIEKASPIASRVSKQWREWYAKDKQRSKSSAMEFLVKLSIFKEVQSMKEAKHFSKDTLEKIIDEEIKREKAYQEQVRKYPSRVWRARGRFARDLLGTFIVTFAFGHGVFLVVYWIIKGFRKG